MPSPTKPSRDAAWFTKQQMADALDITVAYFDREIRRHAKPEYVRQDGKRLMFYCRGVLDEWYRAKQPATAALVLDDLEIDFLMDPMLMDLPNDVTD